MQNRIVTDVCIAGAGPAGIAASIQLSKAGVYHMIVDAGQFPRNKPCGDILTSSALRMLGRVDADIVPNLKAKGKLNPVWHSLVFAPGGGQISLDFLPFDGRKGEPSCYSVSRRDLDAALADKVKESGFADFRENCRITKLTKSHHGYTLETETGPIIETRLLIVATGSGSQLPKQLGLKAPDSESAIGIRAHYDNVNWASQQTALFLEKELMPGGLYLTPLSDGSCNVNLVMSLKRIQNEKKPLREHLEEILNTHPVLKKAFASAVRKNLPEGSRLNLGLRRRAVSGSGFLLAGDAAGLIEFFSGNGIPQAYGSGMLAADTAVQALQKGEFSADFLKAYDKVLLKKFRPEKFSWLLFPLLHKPMISNVVLNFIGYLAGRPQTNKLLSDLLYSKHPEKLARNPRYLYELIFRPTDQVMESGKQN